MGVYSRAKAALSLPLASARITGCAPASPAASDTFSDPFAGTGSPSPAPGADAGTGYYYDSSTLVDTAPPPALSDRTRYEGMPPGDSAARSLPARMRPPGVGPRR